jgi:hypothetical protein
MADGDQEAEKILRACPSAFAMILGPNGELLSSPLDGEGIVTAEIDTSSLIELKRHHDLNGYYSRPDVFQFAFGTDRQGRVELGSQWSKDIQDSYDFKQVAE